MFFGWRLFGRQRSRDVTQRLQAMHLPQCSIARPLSTFAQVAQGVRAAYFSSRDVPIRITLWLGALTSLLD